MARVNKLAKSKYLKARSKKLFFLVHGYTGSPTDFNNLPKYLNEKFNANVYVPRVKGHGTCIDDLDCFEYKDFLNQIERELKKELKKGMKIVIGGISLGGLIALNLTCKYPVKAFFAISIPYLYKFPFNVFNTLNKLAWKKHWKKPYPDYELKLRLGSFNYDSMHVKIFKMIKQAKKELKKIQEKEIPCFIIYAKKDAFVNEKSAKILKCKLKDCCEVLILGPKKKCTHNLFYSPMHNIINKKIGRFIIKNNIF